LGCLAALTVLAAPAALAVVAVGRAELVLMAALGKQAQLE
jgi:hypothetical protein